MWSAPSKLGIALTRKHCIVRCVAMDSPASRRTRISLLHATLALGAGLLFAGCRTTAIHPAAAPFAGDEIIVAGQRFHTGTRVVTWLEPGGYNAYRPSVPLPLRNP